MTAMPTAPAPIRLAIVATHPIQYYAPVFRELARDPKIAARVFYTWSQSADGAVFDPGFGSRVAWDIPLLHGYQHVFVPNTAKRPGSSHFRGIRNPTLRREISSWKADAVLVYGWNLESHLQILRRLKGRIPVLFRGDSTLLGKRSRVRSALRKAWLRWIYSHVDMAIAVGSNNRDYYRWAGLDAEKIAFAPHCIDVDRFGANEEEHASVAAAWRLERKIDPQALVFVFAAKLIPLKEPFLLLEAFVSLPRGAHLVFFGDGELRESLRVKALAHAHIHFMPFQNQRLMPAVYRMGDVYALTSNSETWGLAMNEAMACGRPVIASSRVGGARDIIEEGVTGWTFRSGDAADLARTLELAVTLGREGLRRMGESAKRSMAKWSSEASARGIATAVMRAAGRDHD